MLGLLGVSAGVLSLLAWLEQDNTAQQKAAKKTKKGLPEYSNDEVRKHRDLKTGIWVTYQGNVYDITEFVENHPGGSKIMLAAGGPIEPFWAMYAVHKNEEVYKILAPMKIGTLSKADQEAVKKDLKDPYANDPERLPILHINSAKPFNAEPPDEILAENFYTSNELFFKRNHLPVPEINPADYVLEVEVEGGKTLKYTLEDLKTKFPKKSVSVTLQCAGNRRVELNAIKPVKGLSWRGNAISNATWTGVSLRDVLVHAGVKPEGYESQNIYHIQFEGLDKDLTNQCYGASIPASKAMDPRGDCILAFEMNGQPLPRDHGFPVRAVVPGVVGARNVKWLGKIVASKDESTSFWQQNDYKGFNPSIDWHNVDFKVAPAIQELPIQSNITHIAGLDGSEPLTVKGYAYSGGGRGIVRVDISLDGGKTWEVAKIKEGAYSVTKGYNRSWTWALWEYEIPDAAVEGKKEVEVVVKATDSSYNVQPETTSPIWNLRGVLANAWPRRKFAVPVLEEVE